MSRPAPRIQPREIIARLVFKPNGGHQLEVAVPSAIVSMVFDEDQVRQLERVLAQFREKVTFEEGRSTTSSFQKSIPLEIR